MAKKGKEPLGRASRTKQLTIAPLNESNAHLSWSSSLFRRRLATSLATGVTPFVSGTVKQPSTTAPRKRKKDSQTLETSAQATTSTYYKKAGREPIAESAHASSSDDAETSNSKPAKKKKKESKKKGRGSKGRDLDEEWSAAYGDEAGFKAAVAAVPTSAIRILAPTTEYWHKSILTKFIKYKAAAKDRNLPIAERIRQAEEETSRGAPLPDLALLLEFFTFWAKGSTTTVKDNPTTTMTEASLKHFMHACISARRHLALFSKDFRNQTAVFLYNAPRGPAPLVRAVRKDKKLLSLADFDRVMANIFDRRNGMFKGRSRAALQFAQFFLLLWAFGVRPGAVLLLPQYEDAEGPMQCLLYKDIDLVYEGLSDEGEPLFIAKITFKWMKAMRDHLSENLVVRLRSLPRQKAHVDFLVYFIAHGIYREIFDTDILGLLSNPPMASTDSPIKIKYKQERCHWPVFAGNLSPGHANSSTRGKKPHRTTGGRKAILKRDSVKDPRSEVPRAFDIDYSAPAYYNWASDCFKSLGKELGFSSFTCYDLRRTFCINLKKEISKSDLEYLMGHRPGTKMVDKRYMGDERLQDTTSLRFGLGPSAEVDRSMLIRASVGWQAECVLPEGTTDRLNRLAKAAREALATIEQKYDSLEHALENNTADQDVQELADRQVALVAELDLHRLQKQSALATASASTSKTTQDAANLSISRVERGGGIIGQTLIMEDQFEQEHDINDSTDCRQAHESPSLPDQVASTSHDPRTSHPVDPTLDPALFEEITFRQDELDNLPPLPPPLPAQAPLGASLGYDSVLSLRSQVQEALCEADAHTIHPLQELVQQASKGKGYLTAVEDLLDRLRDQDIYESMVCKICWLNGGKGAEPPKTKPGVSMVRSIEIHTFSCENKLLEDTHQRCPFCSHMIPFQNASEACGHFLACLQTFTAAKTTKYKEHQEKTQHSNEELPNASSDEQEGVDERDGKEEEEDSEDEEGQESALSACETDEDSDERSKSLTKSVAKLAKNPGSFLSLLNPETRPAASFWFPTRKGHASIKTHARFICPLCLPAQEALWKDNVLGSVRLPVNGIKDLFSHLLTHMSAHLGKVGKELDWGTTFLCGLPGCEVSGDLKTLFPHWHKVHDLTFIRYGSSGEYRAKHGDIPDVLPQVLPFRHNLLADAPEDSLSIACPSHQGLKRSKQKRAQDGMALQAASTGRKSRSQKQKEVPVRSKDEVANGDGQGGELDEDGDEDDDDKDQERTGQADSVSDQEEADTGYHSASMLMQE